MSSSLGSDAGGGAWVRHYLGDNIPAVLGVRESRVQARLRPWCLQMSLLLGEGKVCWTVGATHRLPLPLSVRGDPKTEREQHLAKESFIFSFNQNEEQQCLYCMS